MKTKEERINEIKELFENEMLPVGTYTISNEECVVHHIPTGRSFTVPEAAEMAAAVSDKNLEVLNHVYTDTEQTILVNVYGEKMVFTRTREDKNAEWNEWQMKTIN